MDSLILLFIIFQYFSCSHNTYFDSFKIPNPHFILKNNTTSQLAAFKSVHCISLKQVYFEFKFNRFIHPSSFLFEYSMGTCHSCHKKVYNSQRGSPAYQSEIKEQSIKGKQYPCSYEFGGGKCGEQFDVVDETELINLPHRHTGAIICKGPGGYQYGTGTLISRDLVLTCAHVLYNKPYQNFYDPEMHSILFYPKLSGKMEGWIRVKQYRAPEQFVKKQKFYDPKAYDYALLKLSKPVDEKDFMSLNSDPHTIEKENTLSIYGYPLSKYQKKQGKPMGTKQYGLTRQEYIMDLFIDAGYIVHRISTEQGQSGASAVKTDEIGEKTIIGIHIGSTQENLQEYKQLHPDLVKVNLIRIINQTMVKVLTRYAKQLEGEMFSIKRESHMKGIMKYDSNMEKMSLAKIPSSKASQTYEKSPKAVQYFIKASNLRKEEKYEDAIECYKKAVQIDPEYTSAYHNIGYVYNTLKRYNQAIQWFSKVIQISQNYVLSHVGLGFAYKNVGKYTEAIESYKRAIRINPNYALAYNDLGVVMKKTEDYEGAIKSYKTAIKIDNRYVNAYCNLGLVLNKTGKYEEAKQNFEKAIKIDKTDSNLHFNLGKCLIKLNQLSEAVDSYQETIKLNPNNNDCYENLKVLLKHKDFNKIERLRKIEESVRVIDDIINMHSDNQKAKETNNILKSELAILQK